MIVLVIYDMCNLKANCFCPAKVQDTLSARRYSLTESDFFFNM